MKAYKFLKADMRSGEGHEPPWEIGVKRKIPKEQRNNICLGAYGYHASPSLWDALSYARGPIACLVEIGKPIAKDETKSVSAWLTIVKAANIDRELRLFAADCAERVLYIFERAYPNDKRPQKAIQAVRDFANGKIGPAARAAAGVAACGARCGAGCGVGCGVGGGVGCGASCGVGCGVSCGVGCGVGGGVGCGAGCGGALRRGLHMVLRRGLWRGVRKSIGNVSTLMRCLRDWGLGATMIVVKKK